ncbi:MAG: DegT/DnrJ/EryC1/StrS family aminotransferase [Verrucomicrobia bacterium]|nr:DegT/DnrJ/EryC1/StrS family aminotransferase [Verrucomicrobiota bacterium]
MSIPFIDLKTQFDRIAGDVRAGIEDVFASAGFIMGPQVGELENRLAQFAGVRHCVSCASGTDALLLPLMALGIGPGDAVFTTPFTFIATAEVVSLLGATPVFVDIDPVTFNMDPDALAQRIIETEKEGKLRGKAIIPVDLFGQPADYDRINAIAFRHDMIVLGDAAQAFGATYKGKRTGALAYVTATSFFPAKPLGCYGDGGATFTNDESLAHVMDSIRIHGKGDQPYSHARIGLNARMDTMQAAILLAKLNIYEDEIEARHRVAETYHRHLSGIAGLTCPSVAEGNTSVWAQYSLLCDKRASAMGALKEAGVPTAIYYPRPLHLQDAFADLGYTAGDFPVSEFVSARIFSLPFHPYLEEKTILTIRDVLYASAS